MFYVHAVSKVGRHGRSSQQGKKDSDFAADMAEIKAISVSTQDSIKELASATKTSFKETHKGMETVVSALESTISRVSDLEKGKASAGAVVAEEDSNKSEDGKSVTFDATADSGAISHTLANLKNLKSALKRKS